MSVFTWGSAIHSALGFAQSHTVNSIDIPKRVDSVRDAIFSVAVTGKRFTILLDNHGKMFRFGVDFGILPDEFALVPDLSHVASDYNTGFSVGIARSDNLVYVIGKNTAKPLTQSAACVYATDICCTGSKLVYVIDKGSGSLLEFGKTPRLNELTLRGMSPAKRLFGSSEFCAVTSNSGEVRVWDTHGYTFAKPMRVVVHGVYTDSEWSESQKDFILHDPIDVSLPSGGGQFGYAAIHGGERFVRFNLHTSSAFLSGNVVATPNIIIKKIVQNRDFVYILTTTGKLFQVTHTAVSVLDGRQILGQVTDISCSSHHMVAIVQIFPIPTLPNSMSLRKICSEIIFANSVSVESVVATIRTIIDRPVSDFRFLLDLCVQYLRLNEDLVRCLEGVDHTGDWIEQLLASPVEMVLVADPPTSRKRVHKKSLPKITPPSPPRVNIVTPSIAPTQCPIIPDSEFVPLEEAAVPVVATSGRFSKVKKWNSVSEKRPKTAVQAPWSGQVTSVESVASFPIETPEIVRRQIASRWFLADETTAVPSVDAVIAEQREEEEIREAIRLVEEFEGKARRNDRCILPRH
jgi:hypothetical protein